MGQRASRIIVGLLIVVLFLATGCDLGMLEGNTGSLAISLGSSSRSLVWEPELDMDIASYTIKGTGPTANDAFEVSGHTEGLFTKDGLAVGNWTITVDGYNSDSEKIATVQAAAAVTRNATTPVTVVLRPLEGTGTLSVSMSWTDSQGVLANPTASLVIRDEQGADIQDISDSVALTINGQTAAAEVTDLPTGWYEVTVSLKDGNTTAWQGVFALRVVKDQTTTGTVVIDEAQIQIGPGTGTVAITIEEDMDSPLSVGFSGMPGSVEAGDTVMLISTGSYSGNVQYRWYINGVRQTDQTASSFSHTFDTAGTQTVSLLVLNGGALGGYGASVIVVEVSEYSIPLRYVEGGTFQIGSNDYPNEQPIHSVTVDSFYIGTYEITQDIYEEVMGANPSFFRGSRLPVEMVSWYDAAAFANALSRRDGLDEVYTINGNTVTCDWTKRGYRLPTEAEWEFAARGGLQSQGYLYAGSNTVGNVAWFRDNSSSRTHDSGTKTANELGLYDMSGNVWEWCWDWYGDVYPSDLPQTNPTGLSTGSSRVLRGGCWGGDSAMALRSSARYLYTPSDLYKHIGFRLILPVEGWKYEVGALGPSGGYVFYDDEIGYDLDGDGTIESSEKNLLGDGKRFLEAATADIKVGTDDYRHIFGYYRATANGITLHVGTATSIGTGKANTAASVAAMGDAAYMSYDSSITTTTGNYAARLCFQYEAGGYDDWFLPSKDELNLMYQNLKWGNCGCFSDEPYLSSSEATNNIAWTQNIINGDQYNAVNRGIELRVRPVRAF